MFRIGIRTEVSVVFGVLSGKISEETTKSTLNLRKPGFS